MDTSNLDLAGVERSFDPSKRAPPDNQEEARLLVRKMLDSLPSKERDRLRNLAWSVDYATTEHGISNDRIYCALSTVADLLDTTPRLLAEYIIQKGTCVGTLMIRSR